MSAPEKISPLQWCLAELQKEDSWFVQHSDAIIVGLLGIAGVLVAIFGPRAHRYLTLQDYHDGVKEAEERVARNAPYRH